MGRSEELKGLTRRSFLKTGAVAAAGASLATLAACSNGGAASSAASSAESSAAASSAESSAAASSAPAAAASSQEAVVTPVVEETRVFNSCMGNCAGMGCPAWVSVREGKVANIEPARLECPDGSESPYQHSCMKAYTNIERMYSDTRVLYPMKRTGERGSGEFERITWDQAIQEITDKWKELIETEGPESIAFFSGSGTYSKTPTYYSRLQAVLGVPNCAASYDWTGMFCQWEHAGFHTHINGHNEFRDVLNADTIFMWGTNPSESVPTNYHLLTQALEQGTKLIVIDPVYTTSASKADMFVPIHPCTDGLLACGMALISLRDGFMDKKCLQTLTVGPFLVKDDGMYLRLSDLGEVEAGSEEDMICVWDGGAPVGFATAADPEVEGEFEVEGVGTVKPAAQILIDRLNEWDLETISEITEIPLDTIEELAKIWNSGNSMIWTGFGPDHYSNGQTAYEGMWALMDLTGQIGQHGRGCCCTDFSGPSSQGFADVAAVGIEEFAPGGTIYPTYLHKLMEGEPQGAFTKPFKSMFVYWGNPITNETDRSAWIRDFEKMDMVVTVDPFMCETALYSDYVLPASFLYEHNDIATSFTLHTKLIEKAVEPLGEAVDDFEICCMLGRAMGFEDYFTDDIETYIEKCLDNEVAAGFGISYDALKEQKAIFAYTEEPFVLGLTTPPYTATGRFEFYHEGIQPQFNAGQEWDMKRQSAWFWEPPIEAWPQTMGNFPAAEEAAKYPYLLISERCKFKTHTQFNNAPMILEIDPEPYVKINPDDAKELGVAEGDVVRLANDRGFVDIKVVEHAGCRPGIFLIDHGWERDSYIDGHYSDLPTSESWARHAQNNWFDCMVSCEKI